MPHLPAQNCAQNFISPVHIANFPIWNTVSSINQPDILLVLLTTTEKCMQTLPWPKGSKIAAIHASSSI